MLKMQIFWTIEKMDTLDNKASRHNVIIGKKMHYVLIMIILYEILRVCYIWKKNVFLNFENNLSLQTEIVYRFKESFESKSFSTHGV